MKRLFLGFIVTLIVTFFSIVGSAQSSSTGYWIQCINVSTGLEDSCWIGTGSQTTVNVTVNLNSEPAQSSRSQQTHQHKKYYSPEKSPEYDSVDGDETPVYQTQRRKTVRQDYEVGVSPYSRRPFGRYSRSTETTTITVTTNRETYQPNIRVDAYGNTYHWPRY